MRRRISDGSTIITWPAPAARANCTANSPIGPAPWTTTVSPGTMRERRTPWNATVAGSTCAASASVRSGWAWRTRAAATLMLGAKPPCGGASGSRPLATADTLRQCSLSPLWHSGHEPHAGGTAMTTRSPLSKPSTAGPMSATVPTHSCPHTDGLWRCPLRNDAMSVPQMPQSVMSTVTQPARGGS